MAAAGRGHRLNPLDRDTTESPSGSRKARKQHVLLVAEQLRRHTPGGIGTYVRGLVQGLGAMGGDAPELTLWSSRPRSTAADEVAGLSRTSRVISSRLPGSLLVRAWDRGLGDLPAADAVHAPSLTVPPSGGAPMTVTVHDLAWRRHPGAFTARGRRWHDAALERARARAATLVAPSRSTADDLVSAGIPAARIEVIAEGSDHLPRPDHGAAAELLTSAGVPGRFLLSVSTLEPRKNLPRLVAAFQVARERFPERWSLVVVGPAGWGAVSRSVGDVDGVFLTGAVPGPTLSALYERALALAYVPVFEGFGLPPVEAMRAGVPVVASPMPSTGSAALEVDPSDTGAIAEALVRATTDDTMRAELTAAGQAHAATLTWEATARRHVDLWERLS